MPPKASPPPPKNELLFRIIKIIDIAYIAILYFIVGYFLGYYIDEFFVFIYGTEFQKKSKYVLILEILSQVISIGIISYIGRNLVELIPFPLDGVNGFIHQRVRELKSGAFLTVFIVMFQYSMQDKLIYLKSTTKPKQVFAASSPSPASNILDITPHDTIETISTVMRVGEVVTVGM